ncbi:MAG: hypothetical protein HKP59_04765 [Lutibacter sp.]|uniref:hypothetical protein n=1 Tax=Lutibacter sp. TaxID=1925666 RepID=UPI0017F3F2DC|nr:hypothetical protein [Lutibacter sp.]MBT8316914.1 hypothetical protein [Lutibacter sp.]NNJ57774.1 hypothetical protein [Lutibacter sp.]
MGMIKNKVILGILFIVFVGIVLFIFFVPITTTFNITVDTERISYETLDKNNSRLIVMEAEIADEDAILSTNFSGTIDLNAGVKVTVERIAFGPISIIIESLNSKSIGKIYNGQDGELFHEATDYLEVYIYDVSEKTVKGQTYIFSIDGKVNLGRSVNLEIFGESTALLRNGDVKMIGKTFLSDDYFEAGSKELNLGDRLVFDKIQSKTFGFVTINENPGMSAAYRVTAKEARVIKPGPQNDTSGYMISASLLDRFLKDRMFQGLSIFFGFLVIITTLITFVKDITKN